LIIAVACWSSLLLVDRH